MSTDITIKEHTSASIEDASELIERAVNISREFKRLVSIERTGRTIKAADYLLALSGRMARRSSKKSPFQKRSG